MAEQLVYFVEHSPRFTYSVLVVVAVFASPFIQALVGRMALRFAMDVCTPELNTGRHRHSIGQ